MEQGHCVKLYDPQSFTALFEKVFLPTGGVCSRKRRVQILQCLIIIKKNLCLLYFESEGR